MGTNINVYFLRLQFVDDKFGLVCDYERNQTALNARPVRYLSGCGTTHLFSI